MNPSWKRPLQYIHETTTASLSDLRSAPFALLRQVRTRTRIEQGKPGDPLRREAQDFERDVTAHRQPRQRELRWRGGKDAACNSRHTVITGMVGNHDWPAAPQFRDLTRVQAR